MGNCDITGKKLFFIKENDHINKEHFKIEHVIGKGGYGKVRQIFLI